MLKGFVNHLKFGAIKSVALLIRYTSAEERRRFLGNRIVPLLRAARSSFCITDNAEITAELNPAGDSAEFLSACKTAGVNRLSIGAQSGSDEELLLLGRTHTVRDTAETVKAARAMGFKNISLDLMCGLPGSNTKSLKKSLDFTVGLSPSIYPSTFSK